MNSSNPLEDRRNGVEPKTPHEEIMFCIESTNDIVSKILEIHEEQKDRRIELIGALNDMTTTLERILRKR